MKRIRRALRIIVMLCGVLLLSLFAGPTLTTRAVEIPPVGSPIFIQTNGPQADIGLGDWYSSAFNGVGGGYHYFKIHVPCRWPVDQDFHIDLFSPEINTFLPPPREDQVDTLPIGETIFELYSPTTPVALPRNPGPGAAGSIYQATYSSVSDRPERWERFYTLPAPVTCGQYLLRVETRGDEQNGWRLRFGHDNDADPNNALPPNYDNPDNIVGTGDETSVSILQTTYEHTQSGQVLCLLLYQYVSPGIPSATFNNFDLDDNERVTYYPPSADFDPEGALLPGSIAGTVSGFTVWNNGTQTTRGGDTIANPEPGWWRIVTCVRDGNQFNQEGQLGVPIFRQPSPEPDMLIRKDDGRTVVAPGDVLTYTISFSNIANRTRQVPGAAFDVTISDSLPANTSFRSCRLVTAGLQGTCAQSGNNVVFRLNDPVAAGVSGQVEVSVVVNPGAGGQVLNQVALDYKDTLGNSYPTMGDDDLDLIPNGNLPNVDALKEGRISLDANGNNYADVGDHIEYTISVSNAGPGVAGDIVVRDTPDSNTRLLFGTVRVEPGPGQVIKGNNRGDRSVEARLGSIAPNSSARVRFEVEVLPGLPDTTREIVNQGRVRGGNVPDLPTDDPKTPAIDDPTRVPTQDPGNAPPTAIDLLDFRAERANDGVHLIWRTGAEFDSLGFRILRGVGDNVSEAAIISPQIIARGSPTGGADYSWIDSGAVVGQDYRYWLEEQSVDGTRTLYGPISAAPRATATDDTVVYLPLL